MHKMLSLVMGLILLLGLTVSVQAAETTDTTAPVPTDQGEVSALGGNGTYSLGKFSLFKDFNLIEIYNNEEYDYQDINALKVGLQFRPSDAFSISGGGRYDFITKETIPFGRFDFMLPFGDNLKIAGYCDQNYDGNNWANFEAAIRIEVYNHLYVFSGIRGEFGDEAPAYSYNPDNEPCLFLRGDFNWKAGRFDFSVQPYLYIQGIWFHDYTIKYNFSDRVALVFNMNSLFDENVRCRAGLQWKF